MRLEIHFNDLIFRNSSVLQMLNHQPQQAGLAAAANAGYYFNRLRITECDEFIQIMVSAFEIMGINHRKHLLYQYDSTNSINNQTLCTKMQKLLYFDDLCKTDESCTVAFCCCVADFCKIVFTSCTFAILAEENSK